MNRRVTCWPLSAKKKVGYHLLKLCQQDIPDEQAYQWGMNFLEGHVVTSDMPAEQLAALPFAISGLLAGVGEGHSEPGRTQGEEAALLSSHGQGVAQEVGAKLEAYTKYARAMWNVFLRFPELICWVKGMHSPLHDASAASNPLAACIILRFLRLLEDATGNPPAPPPPTSPGPGPSPHTPAPINIENAHQLPNGDESPVWSAPGAGTSHVWVY